MELQTLTSYLKLLTCEGIGVLNARKLLEHVTDVSELFTVEWMKDFHGTSDVKRLKKSLKTFDQQVVDEELKFIEANKIKYVGILDSDYPKLLRECPDAPVLLFYKGDLSLLNNHSLAIVGTRKITPYGKEMIQQIVSELKPYNPTLVSGMAYGADVNVYHQAKQNNLACVAVMGTSFKKYYPKAHEKFYWDLEQNGLIVSEYAGFNTLAPELFLRRNRIIAGLSQATVVIESPEKGGSLATAFFANDYGREVYAVPGKITDEYSKGCLRLIQQNKAQLLFDLKNLCDDLNWNANTEIKEKPPVPKEINWNDFSVLQQTILKSLQNAPLHIDELALQTQLEMPVLNAELMMLELNGTVVGLPGKIFKLK